MTSREVIEHRRVRGVQSTRPAGQAAEGPGAALERSPAARSWCTCLAPTALRRRRGCWRARTQQGAGHRPYRRPGDGLFFDDGVYRNSDWARRPGTMSFLAHKESFRGRSDPADLQAPTGVVAHRGGRAVEVKGERCSDAPAARGRVGARAA